MSDDGAAGQGRGEGVGEGSGEGTGEGEVRIPTGRVTGETTEAIESATLILVRDRRDDASPAGGFEVFMLERHIETDFAGGALVFPGGRVEEADRHLPPSCWAGLDLEWAAAEMDAPADAVLGWHVAAVREAFEESGFLLAQVDGRPVTRADLAHEDFRQARERLGARNTDWHWGQWLSDRGLRLDLGALAWWSWWETPHGLHRRYTTRFFVARVPPDQTGGHDEVETVSSRWLTPEDALQAATDRMATVIYPTRQNLRALARFGSVDEVLSAARSGQVDRRRHLPEIVRERDRVRIRHPFTGELDEP